MRYTTQRYGETTNLLGKFIASRPAAHPFSVSSPPTTQITATGHPYGAAASVVGPHTVRSSDTLPTPLSDTTDYWIRVVGTNTIQFHTSESDAESNSSPVSCTNAGTGTHTISSAVQMFLIDTDSDALVTLDDGDCDELTTSTRGGLSTYRWNTSKITVPSTVQAEYQYLMEDRYTEASSEGKLIVGGFPDESAKRRYQGSVHIDGGGLPLNTKATMGAVSLTFATGGTDTITRSAGTWTGDGFAVGDRLQISGTPGVFNNDGVTVPIVAFSVADTVAEFPGGAAFTKNGGGRAFVADGPRAGITVLAKSWTFDAGTDENPVNNVRDARQIADELDLTVYHLHGGATVTVDFDHEDWIYEGTDPDADIVTFEDLAGTGGSTFRYVGIRGDLNGRIITENCIIGVTGGLVTGLQGVLSNTGGAGTWELAGGAVLTGLSIAARDILGVTVDFVDGDAANQFLAGGIFGIWRVRNMKNFSDICGVTALGAELTLDSTNNSGTVRLGGLGEVVYSGTVNVFDDDVVKGSWVTAIANNTVSRARIDITTDPWIENRYTYRGGLAQDTTVFETYELYDQNGAAINGDENSGNNPLADETVLIAERKRV